MVYVHIHVVDVYVDVYVDRHEDVIVTPFAQILQTLRTVRNNFMFITKVSNPK